MNAPIRRPEWLRKEKPLTAGVVRDKAAFAASGLHTVCESARCPNLSECFRSGNATFLIMGDRCTQGVRFLRRGPWHAAPTGPRGRKQDRAADRAYLRALRGHHVRHT